MTSPFDPNRGGAGPAPTPVPGRSGYPPFGPPPEYWPTAYYPPVAEGPDGFERPRRRGWLLIAAAAVAAVVAGAVSAYLLTRPTEGAAPAAALHEATGRTLAASSYMLDEHLSLRDGISTQDINLHGTVDDRNGLAQAQVSSGSTSVTTVVEGDQAWLSSTEPAFNSLLPAGKNWLHASVAQMQSLGIWHPLSDSLAALHLIGGAGPVTDHGHASVAGTPVSYYTFPVDLHKAYCATAAAERAAVQRAFHANGMPVTGQAWVDGHGQLVKFAITAQGSGGVHLFESVQLGNLNQPVHVSPPPQANTVTTAQVPGLLGALSRVLTHTTPQPPVAC